MNPEQMLAEKLSARLGVNRDDIDALADPPQEPGRTATRRRPFHLRRRGRLPAHEAAIAEQLAGPEVARFEPDRFEWPSPGRVRSSIAP